jgi:iron complex outermembrane recepter protein
MRTIPAGLCTLIALVFCDVSRAEAPRVSLHIESQPIRLALKDLGEQTGLQIMFRSEDLDKDGLTAPQIVGELSPQEALDRMLVNTELQYRFVNPNTVLVSAKEGRGAQRAALTSETGAVRLAQAETAAGGATAQGDGRRKENSPTMDREAASTDETLEEITVTAQKRVERLRDVPISISVVSARDLESASVFSVNDALKRVAGVTSYESQQGGMTKFNIRGVASNSSLLNGSSTVGYYLDEIPFGFVKFPVAPDANAYDLDRVEVLRGPQGTLYGANALNGVVRVITKDANLQEFASKARGTLSTTEEGAENYRADLAVNLPLVQDRLGVRAVLGYGDYSGWVDQTGSGRSNVNDAEQKNLRLKINARPVEDFNVALLSWFSRDDHGAANVSFDNQTVPTNIPEPIETDFDAYALTMTYDFSGMSLLSTTSYMDFRNFGILNTGGGPLERLSTELGAEVVAQELRLNSSLEGPWKWSAGGIYRDEKDLLAQQLQVGFPGQTVANNFTSKSFAIFGELTRTFLDERLELTGGLRYFDDKNEAIDLGFIVPPGQPTPALLRTESKSDALTPRLVLTWKPHGNLSAYGSYSQGFRSGFTLQGAQVQILPAGFPAAVGPDRLHNYEVGAKGNALNRRVAYDVAVYFIDWQDTVQRLGVLNQFGINTFLPLNAQSASGFGVDFGGNVELTDGLEVGATMSWNDLTFDSDVVSAGAVLYPKGSRLDESPELTAGVNFDYSFPVGGKYRGSFGGSANFHSEMISRTATATFPGDDILVARLSFGIDADRWGATLFADNITDEGGIVRPIASLTAAYSANRLRPRTYGIQVDFRF